MTTVVTFDVDGTLVTSEGKNANRLHKLAFAHAWRTVFSFEADIDEVPHHVRPHWVHECARCRAARDRCSPGLSACAGDDRPFHPGPSVGDARHTKGAGKASSEQLQPPRPCAGQACWIMLLSSS